MGKRNLTKLVEHFTVEMVALTRILQLKRSYVFNSQILRSSSSIKANHAEARFAQSDKDYITKIHIALKEANETKTWLFSIYSHELITKEHYERLSKECSEIIRQLYAISISMKNKKI